VGVDEILGVLVWVPVAVGLMIGVPVNVNVGGTVLMGEGLGVGELIHQGACVWDRVGVGMGVNVINTSLG